MDTDSTFIVLAIGVVIFSVFVYRSVMSDFRRNIRKY